MVVDTREQTPLFENEPWVIKEKLLVGDYSIKGFENQITIERKGSLSDLYSSLGKQRNRFEKEINRAKNYLWRGLIIEETEEEALKPQEYSGLHPNVIYHSLASLELRGWHIHFSKTKENAQWWVLSRLAKFFKYMREGRT